MRIHTQFVQVGRRNVLVRHVGHGPALVLLHQSPQSSRALLPWIERLGGRYAVFAPDTPGFGASDGLPAAQPHIPDFSAALALLFERLGLERALLYGVHTGAVIALRFALDYPHKVAAVVCDGFARFDADERNQLLAHYLPPLEPQWHGGHLLWLFARMREQHLYFPWHDGRREARLAYPMPMPERVHEDVLDVLAAGDGYRVGYRAPFLYDDATAPARLTVPAYLFYRAEDPLASHLARLPAALPGNVVTALVQGGPPALAARTDEVFARHGQHASRLDAAACVTMARSESRRVFATPVGQLACRVRPGSSRKALLTLRDIGHPAELPHVCPVDAIGIAPDLPGHGASGDWPTENLNASDLADALTYVLASLPIEHTEVSGDGGSAVLALMVAERLRARCVAVTISRPLPLDASERDRFLAGLPDPAPRGSGAHLLETWNWVRHKALFPPWAPPDAAHAERVSAPAPTRVHAEVVEVLRAGSAFGALWRSVLAEDLNAWLARVPAQVLPADSAGHQALLSRLTS